MTARELALLIDSIIDKSIQYDNDEDNNGDYEEWFTIEGERCDEEAKNKLRNKIYQAIIDNYDTQ